MKRELASRIILGIVILQFILLPLIFLEAQRNEVVPTITSYATTITRTITGSNEVQVFTTIDKKITYYTVFGFAASDAQRNAGVYIGIIVMLFGIALLIYYRAFVKGKHVQYEKEL
jgi:hypothetical protein